ncbi:MAG: transporter substrate-binding domain-containing protein [Cyanothece sp. SIO2G6]|nr:transporter substrate-binding domain-containing protein [Cyanothece sp. SIO2G6]
MVAGASLALGLALGTDLTSHGAELSEILERGHLVVGVKDNVRPLGFHNESGELVGFEIDLARQLALELLGDSNAVQLQPVANRDRLPLLLADDVDVVIARMSVTTPRARLVDFSLPYYLDGTALVTRLSGLADVFALSGQKVGVLDGASTVDIVRSRVPGVELVGVESYQAALAGLETGAIAAFAADVSVLSGWVQEYPQYRIFPTLLSGDALAIAMPRGVQYQSLRQQVDAAVESWTESGWLQERMEHWGLP